MGEARSGRRDVEVAAASTTDGRCVIMEGFGRMRRGEEEDVMMMIGVGCGERGAENEGGRGYWYFRRIVTRDKDTVHMMMNVVYVYGI